MLDSLQNHPAKTGTAFGGGLSIGLALYLFAPKGEVALLKDRMAEEHRDNMDREAQCEARFTAMLTRRGTNSVLTAGGTGGRVPQ